MTVKGTNKVYDKAVKESAEKTEKIKDMFENLGFEINYDKKIGSRYYILMLKLNLKIFKSAELGRNDLKTINIPTEQRLNFRLITKCWVKFCMH